MFSFKQLNVQLVLIEVQYSQANKAIINAMIK